MSTFFKGTYRGINFEYSPHTATDDSCGILIINLANGVESTHIIKNWGECRIFQYVASFVNVV
jgi:hypothetical protein